MNGVDGSQTFTDSSASAHTVTANGNAQIDTEQSKFGGASCLFDGNGDYLSIPNSSDFDFSSDDFTIDFQIMINAYPPSGWATVVSAFQDTPAAGWRVLIGTTGTVYMSTTSTGLQSTGTIPLSTWTHVEISRCGATCKVFLAGVYDKSADIVITSPTSTLKIGSTNGTDWFFNGWIDELRITKGIARHTSDFTPPTSEYDPSYDESITDSFSFDESLNEHPCTHTQTIDESFSIDDTSVMIGNYAASISDSLSMDDSFSMAWDKYISDSLSIDDTSNTKIDYHPVAADSFGVDDTNNTNYTTSPTIEETISMQGLYSATLTVPTRRKKQNTNISGKRISLKFSNDTQDHGLYLEDAIIKLHRSKENDTVSMNHIGGHISMKFQNNTIDETIYLEYVNYIIAPLTGR